MKCYLCKNGSAEPFLNLKNRQLINCESCGLVFVEKTARLKKIDFNDKKFLQEYLVEQDLYRQYFDEKILLLKKYSKKGKLLDLGCGIGTFLGQANINGWKTLGIDSSKQTIDYLAKNGLAARYGNINSCTIEKNNYDVITMFQAIEHFTDPIKVMSRVHDGLKTKGIVMITTPNRKSLLAKISNKHWFGYHNKEHLFFFDQNSLNKIVQESGFKILHSQEESGRTLSADWVLIRLTDYYYDNKSKIRRVLTAFKPLWKYLRWIQFREPAVNLVLVAQKI